MFTGYDFEMLAQERRLQAKRDLERGLLISEAVNSSGRRQASKLLVKLARLMISTGERIMANVEPERKNALDCTSLQRLEAN